MFSRKTSPGYSEGAVTLASNCSGADPGFTKGGAQIHCSEYDNCVRSTRSANLGGSGGMSPQKI